MEEYFIKVDGNELNYYEFLNISIDSNLAEIKRAYRKTSLKYHPDKNPDNPQAGKFNNKYIYI
jgi:DnaJ family protein C protein 17